MQYKISQHALRDFNKFEKTTVFINGGDTIIADSTTIFLGKTNSYFYFFNKNEQSSIIIPSSEVARIKLKSK